MQIFFSYLFCLFPLVPLQLSGPMLLVPSWLWEPSLVIVIFLKTSLFLYITYYFIKNLLLINNLFFHYFFVLREKLIDWKHDCHCAVGLISALCPSAFSTPMGLPQMAQTFQHPVGIPFGHCLVFPGIVSFGTPCMGWTWDQLHTAMATVSWTSLSSQLWGLTEKGAYKNEKTK